MQLYIEQIALFPPDPKAARELLEAMGASEWKEDRVNSSGEVYGQQTANVFNASYEYNLLSAARELEIISYESGHNWLVNRPGITPNRIAYLGMHCMGNEIVQWKKFFSDRGIGIAQEMKTSQHAIPHGYTYHHIIFDTYEILGVDIKLIIRREEE